MTDGSSMRLVAGADPVQVAELTLLAESGFGDLVKAVVDIHQGIMVIGGELHADEERLLLEEHGSRLEDLWGINLYPEQYGEDGWSTTR